MSNKLLFVLFLMLLSTTLLFSQTTVTLETYGVSPGQVEADTVGNPGYIGILDWAYNGLLNVGVGTHMFLEGSGDATLASPAWDVLVAPATSSATVTSITDIDTSTQLAIFIPDVAGTYEVEFSSNSVSDTITINAGTYLGVEGGSPSCASCHNDKFTAWQGTGHSDILDRALGGTLSDHYSESCISCHTTGYDTAATAVNDGFDDFPFVFPDSLGPGILDSMIQEYPDAMARANIQCEACHGPGSRHSGNTADNRMVANLSEATCAYCHQAGSHHVYPSQWAVSRHANPQYLDHTGGNASCVPCHSGSGFVAYIKNGKQSLSAAPAPIAITCAACHDPHDATNPNQLRTVSVTLENGEMITNAGKGALCMNCHKSRRDAEDYTGPDFGYSSHYGPHHGPQAEILSGKNMPTFGKTLPSSPHLSALENACVNCHMAESNSMSHTSGYHTFSMVDSSGLDNVEACAPCHGELTSFAEKKFYMDGDADHDGDGVAEGLQEEVEGMLHELGMMLPPTANDSVDISGRYIYTQTEAKAAYNWFAVEEDRSGGIHNPAFVVSLLKVSMQAVENNNALGTIIAIEDVPNDQGKQVRLIWNKFVDDGVAIDPIETYLVKRDDGDETWTTVAEVTADASDRYALVVPTLYDSTAEGTMMTSFVVVAVSGGGASYTSDAAQGYSVDNLVPMAPQNVGSMVADKDVTISWDEAVDPDVKFYRVFRSTESGFTADDASEIGTTASLEFMDNNALEGTSYYKVIAVDFSGNQSEASAEVEVIITGIANNGIVHEFALSQNYPNPFNPTTRIQVSLKDAGRVTLQVYNALGQKINTLVNKNMTAGVHNVTFNGAGLSSGVYFYKVVVKSIDGNKIAFQDMHKMILMK